MVLLNNIDTKHKLVKLIFKTWWSIVSTLSLP